MVSLFCSSGKDLMDFWLPRDVINEAFDWLICDVTLHMVAAGGPGRVGRACTPGMAMCLAELTGA